MFKKFFIVLFVTVVCNGVANCSPIKANSSDLISSERTPATETVSHINHSIEPKNVAPEAGVHHIENHNVTASANHSVIEGKPLSNYTKVEEIINQGLNTKDDNKTATDPTIKTPNAAASSGSPANSPKPTSPSPPAVPVTRLNTTTELPPGKPSDMSRPIVAGQTTTTATTLSAGTTTKAPVTTPTAVTPTPTPAVSTSTSNVILVHNSSTKGQENRFDGASFVGGIVLTIGLTAIGFIAFKYYKSGKIDGNYRSL